MKKEGIEIDGYKHTWYVIDEAEYGGKTLYLLENEYWGDEAESLIVDEKYNVYLDDVWNGFSDYDEYLEREDNAKYFD